MPRSLCRVLPRAALLAMGMVAVLVSADEASAPPFRLAAGMVTPAAGKVVSAGWRLHHAAGQMEFPGPSLGSPGTLRHGWHIPPTVKLLFRHALAAGWNLRGAPAVTDRMIGEIFTGPAGAPIKIGSVLYSDGAGGFVQADDTDPLLGNTAFWVFSFWGGTGLVFDAPERLRPDGDGHWLDQLEPGWNLYSPPYVVTVPDSSTLAAVWRWDAQAAAYRLLLPGAALFPLEGYWVFRNAAKPIHEAQR